MKLKILRFLEKNPASTLSEIANEFEVAETFISPYLLRFTKYGLVKREDLIEYHYWISERGRKFLEIHG